LTMGPWSVLFTLCLMVAGTRTLPIPKRG